MKHKIGFNRLDRSSAHRKALHRNMVTSLFQYERITTTKAKALEVRRTAEKLITRAKIDSVHNRRLVSKRLFDEGMVVKLFSDIALRMKERPGGYTRILKLGARAGDASEIVILELVDFKLKQEDDKQGKKDVKKDVVAKDEKKSSVKKAASKAEVTKKTTKKEKVEAK